MIDYRSAYEYLNISNIIAIGIFFRLFIFSASLFIPFTIGPDAPISPLHYQTGVDLAFYLPDNYSIKDQLFYDLNTLTDSISHFFSSLIHRDFSSRYPGPIYPIIIWITSYDVNNTIYLSLTVFLTELTVFLLWCRIMQDKINGLTGLLFALMPHTIWFGILVSSDIFFYLFCSFLFYFWSKRKLSYEKIMYQLSIALLLTRPAGLAIVLARKIYLIRTYKFNQIKIPLALYCLLFIAGSIYYAPYYLVERNILNDSAAPLSVSIILESTFSVFGFQESRSDMPAAYFIRYFYGMIFMAGFIGLLLKESDFKIPVIITVVSVVLFFAPTWRYLLPIIPILYFSGCETISNVRNFKRNLNE